LRHREHQGFFLAKLAAQQGDEVCGLHAQLFVALLVGRSDERLAERAEHRAEILGGSFDRLEQEGAEQSFGGLDVRGEVVVELVEKDADRLCGEEAAPGCVETGHVLELVERGGERMPLLPHGVEGRLSVAIHAATIGAFAFLRPAGRHAAGRFGGGLKPPEVLERTRFRPRQA